MDELERFQSERVARIGDWAPLIAFGVLVLSVAVMLFRPRGPRREPRGDSAENPAIAQEEAGP